MSLIIHKVGILDTIQHFGVKGLQSKGIRPGGVMDQFSASIANALVGNKLNEDLLEIHFPACEIIFKKSCIIALVGAHFSAKLNEKYLPLNRPILIPTNGKLQFVAPKYGRIVYLAIQGGLIGQGRLIKNSEIAFKKKPKLNSSSLHIFPWSADVDWQKYSPEIHVIQGREWERLNEESQRQFCCKPFKLSHHADRMGYRLQHQPFHTRTKEEIISSAVNFGTIQLLPNGQTIVLMADHQTTGGYPKIAHVISADLPKLTQKSPGDEVVFHLTDQETAEKEWVAQQKHIRQIQNISQLKLDEFFQKNSNQL
jgi:antagonist of KipI